MSRESVNLHPVNRKRKLNEAYTTNNIYPNEVEAVFIETENMPSTDRTKSYLKIKIFSIIGKNLY